MPPRFGVAVGDEDLANDPPVAAARLAAAALRAGLDGLPVARDVGRIEVEAHRDEPALAGELQRIGILRQTGDADRRMGFLQGLQMRAKQPKHLGGSVEPPKPAFVMERLLAAPELEND